MRGRPMLIAALTVEIFARVLERCGVRLRGARLHHARMGRRRARARVGGRRVSGESRPPQRARAHRHQERRRPLAPGARRPRALPARRDAEREHRRRSAGLGARAPARAHRAHGASWSSSPTARRWTKRRSPPTATSTSRAICSQVVDDIETRSPVQLAAIGIGHDVSLFYRNATTIARIDHLGPALSDEADVAAGRRGRSEAAPCAGLRIDESALAREGTGVPSFSQENSPTLHAPALLIHPHSVDMSLVCPGRVHGFHFISMPVRGPSRPRKKHSLDSFAPLPHFAPARQSWARTKHSLPTRHSTH